MLLQTSLPPNSDGKLPQEFGKVLYVFAENEHGELEANVEDDDHIAILLGTGDFYPATDEDYNEAVDLINSDSQDPDQDDGDEENDDNDDDFQSPVEGEEANVPPPVKSKRAARAKLA